MNAGAKHIGYAVREGRVVHISEVTHGLACGCQCAVCAAPLIAKKGRQRQHHFAHPGDAHCEGALETVLHKLAKDILAEAQDILLPRYVYCYNYTPRLGFPIGIAREVVSGHERQIRSVQLEQPLGEIIPDAYLSTDQGPLLIEVAVTHRVDRKKLRVVRKLNMPLLEIRLGLDHAFLERQELRSQLLRDDRIKTWLFHPNQREVENEWLGKRRAAMRTARARRRAEAAVKPAPLIPRSWVTGRLSKRDDWKDFNTWGEWFKWRHGRYPSFEETQAFAKSLQGSSAHGVARPHKWSKDLAKNRT